MNLTNSSTGKEIVPIAMAIHELVNRLPITMRTQKSDGVRIEEGEVLDTNYTGPILEKVLKEGKIHNETPNNGLYKGTPVIVVPIIENNEIIAAIGVIDTTNGIYSDIMEMSRRPEKNKPGNSRGEFY